MIKKKKSKKKITKKELKLKEKAKQASYCGRIEDRLLQKKEAALYSTKKYYEALMKTATDKVQARYDRKLSRRIAKLERIYKEKKTRQIKVKVYKKEVKAKQPTIGKIKQDAYKAFQLYRKLSLSDKDGMVFLIDVGGIVHRSECVAGHVYSKHNNKHMAFIPENVRPITYDTNRIQGTAPGVYRACNVLDIEELKWLKELSENKLEKNKVLDRNFYQSMYDKYSELLKVEQQRLGIVKE